MRLARVKRELRRFSQLLHAAKHGLGRFGWDVVCQAVNEQEGRLDHVGLVERRVGQILLSRQRLTTDVRGTQVVNRPSPHGGLEITIKMVNATKTTIREIPLSFISGTVTEALDAAPG